VCSELDTSIPQFDIFGILVAILNTAHQAGNLIGIGVAVVNFGDFCNQVLYKLQHGNEFRWEFLP
ncbi:MAG: hypothetical protein OXC17_03435, partial [Aestuariivita sp.]|nr:hypothetical protein [Aestuariivita sp.]